MSQSSTPKQHSANSVATFNIDERDGANPSPLKRTSGATRSGMVRGRSKLVSKKKLKPPKVTAEQLKAVIYAVFGEADEDGNGDLDINECRSFCRKLMY